MSLDGTYTRMLRKALNIHWSSHIPNQQLYGDLPAVSNKIASRRLQLAGHCYRHPELSTQKLVLWEPTHGHRGRGRPNTTYIDTLKRDTGAFEASEIAVLMADKRLWKDLVVALLRATKWVSEWGMSTFDIFKKWFFFGSFQCPELFGNSPYQIQISTWWLLRSVLLATKKYFSWIREVRTYPKFKRSGLLAQKLVEPFRWVKYRFSIFFFVFVGSCRIRPL